MARQMRRLCFGFAAVLALFAVTAQAYALHFPDYLLVCRYVTAAWDAAPTLVAVGIISGVWLDLAVRQFGKPS